MNISHVKYQKALCYIFTLLVSVLLAYSFSVSLSKALLVKREGGKGGQKQKGEN